MINLIFFETDFQKNFLKILSFGYQEISNMKLVFKLKNFKIIKGNEVIRCKNKISGL